MSITNIRFVEFTRVLSLTPPPIYTKHEVEEVVGSYRDQISYAQKDIIRLQKIMGQKAINRQTNEELTKIMDSLNNINLNNATFAEKCDLLAKLGIKVYPTEDGKELRLTTSLQFDPSPLMFSPHIISIASPKL